MSIRSKLVASFALIGGVAVLVALLLIVRVEKESQKTVTVYTPALISAHSMNAHFLKEVKAVFSFVISNDESAKKEFSRQIGHFKVTQ
ncbi:MAG TPA: hypothetical protein ENI11_06120 [Actinobacteria bacterium]|nr:hypothetical protein [Actinomycetota bacterium]